MLMSNRGGEGRASESALRHKVRNLRAKVRLLLPSDVCNKYQKRSKNLMKMLHNKELQQQVHERRWCNRRENSCELYVPNERAKSQKHLFHKLTKAEIEQIMEDKLYYVGEDFIGDFNKFLEERNKAQLKTGRLTPSESSPQLVHKLSNIERTINLEKSSSNNYSESNETIPKENKLQKISRQLQINLKLRNGIRFERFMQKRKLISEQEQSRRRVLRAQMLEKEERHMVNFQRSSVAREHSIRQWNHTNEVRTSQSIRAKQRTEEVGEIAQLSQKLRSLCLQRCIQFR